MEVSERFIEIALSCFWRAEIFVAKAFPYAQAGSQAVKPGRHRHRPCIIRIHAGERGGERERASGPAYTAGTGLSGMPKVPVLIHCRVIYLDAGASVSLSLVSLSLSLAFCFLYTLSISAAAAAVAAWAEHSLAFVILRVHIFTRL